MSAIPIDVPSNAASRRRSVSRFACSAAMSVATSRATIVMA